MLTLEPLTHLRLQYVIISDQRLLFAATRCLLTRCWEAQLAGRSEGMRKEETNS